MALIAMSLSLSSCSTDEEAAFGAISGHVYDESSPGEEAPAGIVLVTLTPGNQTQRLENYGYFGFYDLEPGMYTLTLSADGYETVTQTVSVTAGGISECDVAMKRSVGFSSLELASTSVTIDYTSNEAMLRMRNKRNSTLWWSVYGITVPWLTVSPKDGSLNSGAWGVLNISIDRKAITESGSYVSTSFIVCDEGNETPVHVTVRTAPGGNTGEDDGRISGRVMDSATRISLPGTKVFITPGSNSVVADADGFYTFENLEPGQYTLTASKNGYATGTSKATVNSGMTATANILLDPEIPTMEVTPAELDFGSTDMHKVVTITNTGTGAYLEWNVATPTSPWLSVGDTKGTLAQGKSTYVEFKVDRTKMTSSSASETVRIWSAREQINVRISASKGSGGSTSEDYSSATVRSCDYRVEASIVSCYRSGNNVTFTYTLTNNLGEAINDWRIYPPEAISMISGGSYSQVWDNLGNEYSRPTFTFRSASTSGANVLNTQFPSGMPCRGTVTVKGVPSTAAAFNVVLGVYAYPNSYYKLAGSTVTFTNVPIY